MILIARLGSLEIICDDEQPGIQHPEHVEDIAHRLGRQCVEVFNMLPDATIVEDGE